MNKCFRLSIFVLIAIRVAASLAEERPYITTTTPVTLLSANDGETDVMWRQTLEGLIDYEVKTEDSFTVIRLGPGHPPICKTVYGTVPCSIAETPTMAMSADGHFGLITNHGGRPEAWGPIAYREGVPLTNDDIRGSPCFWITPAGDRILATQGDVASVDRPAPIHWYSFDPKTVTHLSEVKVLPGVDTHLLPQSAILRVSLDGRIALDQEYFSGDGVHFNENGREVQAKQVADAVVSCLAKVTASK